MFFPRLFLLALLVFTTLPAAAFAVTVQHVSLTNDLHAWAVEEPSVPVVAIKFSFDRSGYAYDPEGKEGLAYLVSRMLLEGAGDLPGQQFREALEDHAIHLSFSLNEDYFTVTVKTLSAHLDRALALTFLALQSAHFSPNSLERVKQQAYASIEHLEDDANYLASQHFKRAAFPGHPYSRTSLGSKHSISTITPEDLQHFVQERFVQPGVTIGIVGDIPLARLASMLGPYFSTLPSLPLAVPALPDVVLHVPDTEVTVIRDFSQSVAMFGAPGVKRSSPDFFAAYVMNYILGGGSFESRLMQEVREKRGLAYTVYTYLDTLQHAGSFIGYVASDPEKIDTSLDLIRDALLRLQADGVTDEELSFAKRYLVGSFPITFSTNTSLAQFLLHMQLYDLPIDYIDRRQSFIESVTRHDVSRIARELFRHSSLLEVVVRKQ